VKDAVSDGTMDVRKKVATEVAIKVVDMEEDKMIMARADNREVAMEVSNREVVMEVNNRMTMALDASNKAAMGVEETYHRAASKSCYLQSVTTFRYELRNDKSQLWRRWRIRRWL
jgi:hypothetical protein